MQTPELPDSSKQQLREFFDQVTRETQDGTIKWTAANPTTYLWDNSSTKARLMLQRTERTVAAPAGAPEASRKVPSYRFTAIDLSSPPTQMLSVDTTDDHEMNDLLENLYNLIGSTLARSLMTFLKRALER